MDRSQERNEVEQCRIICGFSTLNPIPVLPDPSIKSSFPALLFLFFPSLFKCDKEPVDSLRMKWGTRTGTCIFSALESLNLISFARRPSIKAPIFSPLSRDTSMPLIFHEFHDANRVWMSFKQMRKKIYATWRAPRRSSRVSVVELINHSFREDMPQCLKMRVRQMNEKWKTRDEKSQCNPSISLGPSEEIRIRNFPRDSFRRSSMDTAHYSAHSIHGPSADGFYSLQADGNWSVGTQVLSRHQTIQRVKLF